MLFVAKELSIVRYKKTLPYEQQHNGKVCERKLSILKNQKLCLNSAEAAKSAINWYHCTCYETSLVRCEETNNSV